MSESKSSRAFKKLLYVLRFVLKWAQRIFGAVAFLSITLFFIAPPVLLLLLAAVSSLTVSLVMLADDLTTVILTATGTAVALAALCFSYARAVENQDSRRAGIYSGRLLLGASVALSIALVTQYFDALSATESGGAVNANVQYLLDASFGVTLRATPLLVAFAILRLYIHLLRLAGIAYIHTFESNERRAELEKMRLFD